MGGQFAGLQARRRARTSSLTIIICNSPAGGEITLKLGGFMRSRKTFSAIAMPSKQTMSYLVGDVMMDSVRKDQSFIPVRGDLDFQLRGFFDAINDGSLLVGGLRL